MNAIKNYRYFLITLKSPSVTFLPCHKMFDMQDEAWPPSLQERCSLAQRPESEVGAHRRPDSDKVQGMIKAGYEYVGVRIKNERRRSGLTLAELAKAVGVSASYISQLENAKIVPSLKILDKISTRLSMHLSTLFSEDEPRTPRSFVIFRSDNHIQIDITDRRKLRTLLPNTKFPFFPVHLVIKPGDTHDSFSTHKGMEFGYVIGGTVKFTVKDKGCVECAAGDSLIYDAMLPHCFQNKGMDEAELLLFGLPDLTLADSLE